MNKSISKICFGSAAIAGDAGGYGFGEYKEDSAIALIKESIELGLNMIDTAPIYGFGSAETRIGLSLKGIRDKVQVISKAGVDWHNSKRVNMSNDPKIIEKMLHESLKRLASDYIDIYMIHWPDKDIDIRYSLEVLARAQNQGKIKHIGLSNTLNEDLEKAHEVCKVEYLQAECNLFHNAYDSIDSQGIIKTGWGSLDKGILSQSVSLNRKFDASDCRSWAPWWKKGPWKKKVAAVDKLYKKFNLKPLHLAISFSAINTDISIFGYKSINQLIEISDIMNDPIDSDIINQAHEFLKNELS